ncbi:uncharacterized protein LOC128988743 isoform X4 [Macrosteles quadrilineatus]|uniref:uncharacterized protein LOC128988743 isoform X4 n=1 Tax=Macrosteles quadrilineatus TaxID=74068 RepID=UPI0023E343B2|nr:uncharacterized protein LOC128988743 isoform X4 [Macrosteles quadrilineatus]
MKCYSFVFVCNAVLCLPGSNGVNLVRRVRNIVPLTEATIAPMFPSYKQEERVWNKNGLEEPVVNGFRIEDSPPSTPSYFGTNEKHIPEPSSSSGTTGVPDSQNLADEGQESIYDDYGISPKIPNIDFLGYTRRMIYAPSKTCKPGETRDRVRGICIKIARK